AGADRLVKVWDLETCQTVFRGPCDATRKFGAAYTVAFSPPDGRLLAAGCDRAVRVWDWKKNRPEAPEHTFPGPEHDSIPVAFTRDGRRLATGSSRPQGLSLRDPETGQLLGAAHVRRGHRRCRLAGARVAGRHHADRPPARGPLQRPALVRGYGSRPVRPRGRQPGLAEHRHTRRRAGGEHQLLRRGDAPE